MAKMSFLTSVCDNQELKDVQEFMESFLDCTTGDYELIVVDNGSKPEIEKYLQKIKGSNYTLIRNPINMGLGVSTDQAYYVAKGDVIFRVDSDVVFHTYKWNEIMVDWLRRYPGIGQIGTLANHGGVIGNNNGFVEVEKIMGCCQAIPRDALIKVEEFLKLDGVAILSQIVKVLENTKLTAQEVRRVHLVKRWVQECKGGWDGGFYYGTDDFDQSLLFRYVGLKLAVAPEVSITHKSTSEKPELKEVRHKNVSEGFAYFRTKWALIYQALGDRNDLIMGTLSKVFSNFDGRDLL